MYTFDTEKFYASVAPPPAPAKPLQKGIRKKKKPPPTRSVTDMILSTNVSEKTKEIALMLNMKHAIYYESLTRNLIAAVCIDMAMSSVDKSPHVEELAKICSITMPTACRAQQLSQ